MRAITGLVIIALLAGCASVRQLGAIGPRQLPVFSIKDNGFFSATGMIVVIGSNGEVAASVGGTVSGAGPLAGGVATGLATAGAIGFAGAALSGAIKNVGVTAKGNVDLSVKCPPGSISVNNSGTLECK